MKTRAAIAMIVATLLCQPSFDGCHGDIACRRAMWHPQVLLGVSGSHELPKTPPSGLGAATGHGDKQRRHATLVFAAAAPAADLGKLLTDAQSQFSGKGLIQTVVLVTVLAIAPAILLLVTCFTRIVVVLGLLRQALATGSLPPNQVLFGLALLMTVVVMAPVYQAINRDAITPYLDGKLNAQQALVAAEKHAREFMIRQIEGGRNEKDVYLFLPKDQAAKKDLTWGDVPVGSLIPAFVISELKIAFTIGFGIYLPFLIIDMLVSSVLVSMGMLMLPPVLISLPFKLLLFVLADGWHRVVGTLMTSFG